MKDILMQNWMGVWGTGAWYWWVQWQLVEFGTFALINLRTSTTTVLYCQHICQYNEKGKNALVLLGKQFWSSGHTEKVQETLQGPLDHTLRPAILKYSHEWNYIWKNPLTNSSYAFSLFLFQRIKYWELDYACSLCWPFFSCSMASSHMGSANQRGQASFVRRQRHFYHNNQVISSYSCVWKGVDTSFSFWNPCNNL